MRPALVAIAAIALLGRPAVAADPTQRWYTLTTPHFFVHYYKAGHHDLAQSAQGVANVAERVHAVLVPLLKHRPRARTHIVVTDDTNGANGLAQSVPYNIIRVFLSGPPPRDTLGDYDDWMYGLLMHEYTHILHMSTISGLPAVYNAIFGRTWSPNQVQPGFIIEGVATYEESEHTTGGRVRGLFSDMIRRSLIVEGKAFSIDEAINPVDDYPRGSISRVFGGAFFSYVAHRFGAKTIAELSKRYGGSVLPYAFNRLFRDVTGSTMTELYRDFLEHLRRRYALQVDRIRRRGVTRSTAVTTHGESIGWPRFSVDGKRLVYVASDGYTDQMARVIDTATGKQIEQRRFKGSGVAVLSPDRRLFIETMGHSWRTFYGYSDIYAYDRQTRQHRPLTDGQRANDPDISPDGRSVVFVRNELGKQDLCAVSIDGGKVMTLLRGVNGDQVATPRFSPDGRRVAFSMWRHGGDRDIYELELSSKKLVRLTADRAMDLGPTYSGDGQRLYYASDRDGVFNIYRIDRSSRRVEQVTNVIGGAFSPAVSADESTLYFVNFSARAFDLHKMAIDQRKILRPLPFVNTRPALPASPAPRRYPIARYNPLQTVYPRSWQLLLAGVGGATSVGVQLEGEDAVRRHAYLARVDTLTSDGETSVGLRYSYSGWWPSISLSGARGAALRGGLVVNEESLTYTERTWSVGASVGLPVLRVPRHSLTLSLGYRANFIDSADSQRYVVEPSAPSPVIPQGGVISGVSFGISYGSDRGYLYSISSEEGRRIQLNVRIDHRELGSDYSTVQLDWSYNEYLEMPWLRNHALALRVAGGLIRGDHGRRGRFSIGGFPSQNVITAIIDRAPLGGAYLRGYGPGALVGDQFLLANVEYRFPLWYVDRGMSTLPLFARRLHAALFVDVGDAYYGTLKPERLKVGVGAELLFDWTIFFIENLTARIGFARGLIDPGGSRLHVLIGSRF